jgi:hypothetical protein
MNKEKKFETFFMLQALKKDLFIIRTEILHEGFPDTLIAFKESNFVLVELKHVELAYNKKIKNWFQVTQPSYYKEYLEFGLDNLYVLMEVIYQGKLFYELIHVDQHFIDNFYTIKYLDLIQYRYLKTTSLETIFNKLRGL